MRHFTQGRMQRQVRFLRQQFLQDGDLPFTDVLSAEVVSQALAAIGACWNDRIFTPLVTLWVFLGQVLSADPSCRAAVARLIAHRVSHGLDRAVRRREPIARRGSGCRNDSSAPWPAKWGAVWPAQTSSAAARSSGRININTTRGAENRKSEPKPPCVSLYRQPRQSCLRAQVNCLGAGGRLIRTRARRREWGALRCRRRHTG